MDKVKELESAEDFADSLVACHWDKKAVGMIKSRDLTVARMALEAAAEVCVKEQGTSCPDCGDSMLLEVAKEIRNISPSSILKVKA